MIALLLSLSGVAQAGSLDLLEVGGPWGTPAATNPTAVWWNPAGLAAGSGTQFLIEVAPTFATVDFLRDNPNYGAPPGNPEWNFGGAEQVNFSGPVPYVGVSSDFGLDDLGVGVQLSVPFARGGTEDPNPGPGQFHLRDGNIQAIYLSAGAGWTFLDKVSVGLSGSMVQSSWEATTQVETLDSLRDGIKETGFPDPYCTGDDSENGPCQDYLFEDPNYSAELTFDPLHDTALTFGAGIYVQPIEKVGISLSYNHGMKLVHEGDMHLQFGCPTDSTGAFAAEISGLCDADADGTGTIGYTLPSRVNLGVVLQPIAKVRAELMGGFVGWSAFTDYEIHTEVQADQFEDELCEDGACTDADIAFAEDNASLVSQDRQWARDNRDTFWVGADGKLEVNRFVTVGARAIFDKSAIPSSALSTNNYDADTLNLGALVVVSPIEQLGVGLSFGHQFLTTRTVSDSAFAVTLAEANQKPDRYFYPSANGTYSGSINRIGVSIRGKFLAKKEL